MSTSRTESTTWSIPSHDSKVFSESKPKSKSLCPHTDTMDQIMHEGCKHYSKKICTKCNAFIKWNPRPKTLKDKEDRDKLINILKGLNLSSFEKSFVFSISLLMHLTPKQQDVWEKICDKYDVKLSV